MKNMPVHLEGSSTCPLEGRTTSSTTTTIFVRSGDDLDVARLPLLPSGGGGGRGGDGGGYYNRAVCFTPKQLLHQNGGSARTGVGNEQVVDAVTGKRHRDSSAPDAISFNGGISGGGERPSMSAESRLEKSREQNRLSSRRARMRSKNEENTLKGEIQRMEIYQLMVEEGPDMMSIHGMDHRAPFHFASSAFQRIAGINPRGICGCALTEIIAVEDHGIVKDTLLKIILSPSRDFVIQYRMLTPRGPALLVETSIRTGEQCIVCVSRVVIESRESLPQAMTSTANAACRGSGGGSSSNARLKYGDKVTRDSGEATDFSNNSRIRMLSHFSGGGSRNREATSPTGSRAPIEYSSGKYRGEENGCGYIKIRSGERNAESGRVSHKPEVRGTWTGCNSGTAGGSGMIESGAGAGGGPTDRGVLAESCGSGSDGDVKCG